MNISSIRLGHANNSSSTHSILLNSPQRAAAGKCDNFQYGWEWFHLKHKDDKAMYLSALIFTSLQHDMDISAEHASLIAHSLTGMDPLQSREKDKYWSVYVDHQSVNAFPHKFGEKHHDPEFMKEFVEYIRDTPEITIFGGNDNDSNPPEVIGERSILNALPRDTMPNYPLYSKKDGEWWILYNQETGAKLRVSFAKAPKPYTSGSRPELVDIKITDYCPYGCKFCYQSSTEKGKHAPLGILQQLAYNCKEAKVFEVALGGGETTMHPQFIEVLKSFSWNGVTPNFTTFNMSWMREKDKVEAVEQYCRSFAVSDPHSIKDIARWNDDHPSGYTDKKGIKATLQLPLGCYDEKSIKRALDAAAALYIPVTLLGFKSHGRAEKLLPENASWIIDYLVKSDSFHAFGADSVFVEQFKDQLKSAGISPKLMVNKEGAYSCYIDAVTMQGAASSYTKELHPFEASKPFERFPYVA
jgi:hypothetical protein